MDSFTKKIFNAKNGEDLSSDALVHVQFQKFSRGEFKDKGNMTLGKSKGRYFLSTTPEYGNELVRAVAEKLKSGEKTKVTGVLVSTRDLSSEIKFVDKKQFMGVKQYVLDGEMTKEEILGICDKFLNSFIGFSFIVKDAAGETELKIKPKAPKSAKPSTKSEEAPKTDFCKLYTSDRKLVESFVFDEEIIQNIDSIKKAEIRQDFSIVDIILPKDEKDFAKMREMAKRKGKIIRKLNIDGKSAVKEKEFLA